MGGDRLGPADCRRPPAIPGGGRLPASEFEDERLGKAAAALEKQAADRQRWRERRAERDDPGPDAREDDDEAGDADVG